MNLKENLKKTKIDFSVLPEFDKHLKFVLEREYFDILDVKNLDISDPIPEFSASKMNDYRFFEISEISYNKSNEIGLHLHNIQNTIAAMTDPSHSLISVIDGSRKKTNLYMGLAKLNSDNKQEVYTEYYQDVLKDSIRSNFLGVKFGKDDLNDPKVRAKNSNLIYHKLNAKINDICCDKSGGNIAAFPGLPSIRNRNTGSNFSQGIDRFIEGMHGEEYVLLTIAEPIILPVVNRMIDSLQDCGSEIHSYVKSTVGHTKTTTNTLNIGFMGLRGNSITDSVTNTTGGGTNTGEQYVGAGGVATSALSGIGTLIGGALGSAVPGPGTVIGAAIGGLIGRTAGAVVSTILPAALTSGKSTTFAQSIGHAVSKTGMGGLQAGYSRSWSNSNSINLEVLNKRAEYCETLTDKYVERLQRGKNQGFWNVGVYLVASEVTLKKGKGLLKSIICGDESFYEPIRSVDLIDCKSNDQNKVISCISNFRNPKYDLLQYGLQKKDIKESLTLFAKIKKTFGINVNNIKEKCQNFFKDTEENQISKINEILNLPKDEINKQVENMLNEKWEIAKKLVVENGYGHPLGSVMSGVSTPLNTEELALIMNFPTKEVQGVTIRKSAEFGANYPVNEGLNRDFISLGNIIHKREARSELNFSINKNALTTHGFITGITGSGKTNTCMNLLKELDVPFLIIEPAKTEYRQLYSVFQEIKVFTLGNENVSKFRINPFEFFKGVELTTHIDNLKAVFNASFPMYASMPYILEESIYQIYQDRGWQLSTSKNRFFDVEKVEDMSDYFPTLEDLLMKVEVVVERLKYGNEISMNLQGALKARLSSLITGSKGLMLNSKKSTPIEDILKDRTVLELASIGDDDEKAFLMGLIFSRIYEYRVSKRNLGEDDSKELKHITLIEEAHRLLRNVPMNISQDTSNSRGKAVETFSNFISEIRDYGEGVLVVDQIPAKLAPDVVKNTNLKIVHRLVAQDDRDSIGSTINLDKSQNNELPLLKIGETVMFREGLEKSFMVKVPEIKDDFKKKTDEDILKLMHKYHVKIGNDIYAHMPGLENIKIRKRYKIIDFRTIDISIQNKMTDFVFSIFTENKDAISFKKEDFKKHILSKIREEEDLELNNQTISCYFIRYLNIFINRNKIVYKDYFDIWIKLHQSLLSIWFENETIKYDALIKKCIYLVTTTNINKFSIIAKDLLFRDYHIVPLPESVQQETLDDYAQYFKDIFQERVNRAFPGIRFSELIIKELFKEFLGLVYKPGSSDSKAFNNLLKLILKINNYE